MSRRLSDTLKNEREFNYQQYRHFMVTGNVKKSPNRGFLRIASAITEFLQFLPSMIGVVVFLMFLMLLCCSGPWVLAWFLDLIS